MPFNPDFDSPKPCPSEADQVPTVYLTKEQLHRLAGLACDALVGIQLHTDANASSYVYGEFCKIDDPNEMEHFTIDPDGAIIITT